MARQNTKRDADFPDFTLAYEVFATTESRSGFEPERNREQATTIRKE